MKCYFLRHGLAGDRETWQGSDDERPLTGEGREKMAREARAIEALDLALDLIVTSPLVRAKQTAEIVAKRLNLEQKLVEDPRVGLEFDVARLGAILSENHGCESIMLVGHDPSMSETIGALIGRAQIDLKKGALACVEVRDVRALNGSLLWLVPPRILLLNDKRH